MRRVSTIFSFLILITGYFASAHNRAITVDRFPQKVVTKYFISERELAPSYVRSIAVCDDKVFAGTEDGVLSLENEQWVKAPWSYDLLDVVKIQCEKSGVILGTARGLFKKSLDDDSAPQALVKIDDMEITDFINFKDGYLIGTSNGLLFLKDQNLEILDEFPQLEVKALSLAPDKSVWIGFKEGLVRYDGRTKRVFQKKDLEIKEIRDLSVDENGRVYVASSSGIGRLDENEDWILLTGKSAGLPYEDVLTVEAHKDSIWAGTTMGAMRFDGDRWNYLQGLEYLPADRVSAIGLASDGTAYLGTPRGFSRIQFRMMSLAEKADHFEKATRKRHIRYGLVADSRLEKQGDLSTNVLATSDNDGLWTAMYIASECYRYGATKDEEAKKFARESLEALMFLEEVNEIPGFISRSFAKPDEPHCEGEWDHITSDGKWRWKGDTSSDEVVGHYYAYSIYYDICADDKEKEEIRAKIRLITDYIINNGYYLIDSDGKPTTWGKWNFFHPWYKRLRFWDRGLNSLEILSHLKVAYHITQDEKYEKAYLELALKEDYAKFMVRQKINLPGIFINHSDDELAFLSYYPLLKYEKDPKLLEFYHRSIERAWKIEKPEKNPLFNFIYGAVMPEGTDFDLESAVYTLKNISLDLIKWDHKNSQRKDIKLNLYRGRFGEKESTVPLPPDERSVMKWNGNPYALDSGSKGMSEEAGTFWLLPYWMGRYYGFIVEE